MEQSKKKYSSLVSWSTSLFDTKLVIFILFGLILIGFGVLAYKTDVFVSGDKVEVLNSNTEDNAGLDIHQGDIIVEISGSVEKPAVYKMKTGDRIDDLLIAAGGLSKDADRDWVTKNINRAAKISDGQKIYIYSQSEVTSARKEGGYPPAVGQVKLDQPVLGVTGSEPGSSVNINTASQSELEKLNGIGPVYATNIIEHRPYSNIQELVSKGAISQKVLEKIKNAITAY